MCCLFEDGEKRKKILEENGMRGEGRREEGESHLLGDVYMCQTNPSSVFMDHYK